ncbi:bcap family protein [Schizosaccharomyces cryophilus OY26]|uniref:Endoplasmic reticulum transmembrane protein n=1 Tax=Schizosaccharomyces cryophilus (strain OY26 / ATCC MYA-4695 / CBS 11777 / NBRC 106824 / NRRL Y48691) TaxID=653667 RepID=S9W1N2_SCHCR|nr:bcap family protein [Schizosaccharomyces cryophilus OY26]EPY51920.1 bcap family protein [Schizosaccharomyces cryophilus OY26]
MTIYYMIVFILLMLEIVSFVILSLPLPMRVRKAILNTISNSPIAGKIEHTLKIMIICILVLFSDSVRRVVRISTEFDMSGAGSTTAENARTGFKAGQFYAQRNLYLCGSALFLSLVVNRYYLSLKTLIASEEKVEALQSELKSNKSDTKSLEELDTLRTKLESRDKEYSALSDKYAEATKTLEKKKDI